MPEPQLTESELYAGVVELTLLQTRRLPANYRQQAEDVANEAFLELLQELRASKEKTLPSAKSGHLELACRRAVWRGVKRLQRVKGHANIKSDLTDEELRRHVALRSKTCRRY